MAQMYQRESTGLKGIEMSAEQAVQSDNQGPRHHYRCHHVADNYKDERKMTCGEKQPAITPTNPTTSKEYQHLGKSKWL